MNVPIPETALGLLCIISMVFNLIFLVRLSGMKKPQEPIHTKTAVTESSAGADQAVDVFEKILPSGLLKLLKIKKYEDITVGGQQYASSVIMDINTVNFSEYVYNRQADQIFTYVNRMMDKVIPVIDSHEGLVESFEGGGLTALYQDQYEQAAVAAVSICECIHEMKKQDRNYEGVTIGICHGSIMIGVVGHEKRMTILTLSESKEFAGFLRSIGCKYYAKILVTAGFMEMVEGSSKKFNYRLLGYVYIRNSQTVEKIYDMFDGDEIEVRNRKRKTKMVFEKGVALYLEGQTIQARLHFIEVMKMDRADCAAKEYLLRCDQDLNESHMSSGYLETY